MRRLVCVVKNSSASRSEPSENLPYLQEGKRRESDADKCEAEVLLGAARPRLAADTGKTAKVRLRTEEKGGINRTDSCVGSGGTSAGSRSESLSLRETSPEVQLSRLAWQITYAEHNNLTLSFDIYVRLS